MTVVAQSGRRTYHGADLETGGSAVRHAQDVIAEAIILVPHAIRPHTVHRTSNPQKLLGELLRQVFVSRILGCHLDAHLEGPRSFLVGGSW